MDGPLRSARFQDSGPGASWDSPAASHQGFADVLERYPRGPLVLALLCPLPGGSGGQSPQGAPGSFFVGPRPTDQVLEEGSG